MKTKYIIINLFLFLAFSVRPQVNQIALSPSLVLPKDTLAFQNLRASLSAFLQAAQSPNEENQLVLESEKVETFILLDEINGIENNKKLKDDHFYKAQLLNAVQLKLDLYLIQIAYIGQEQGNPSLRACFTLMAHKTEKGFLFGSPLLNNTVHWKSLKEGNISFHYRELINKNKVKEYFKYVAEFDKKLNSKDKFSDIYYTSNTVELLKLIGVDYKSDYNGWKEGVFSSVYKNRKLLVIGDSNGTFENFDPHDLWHDRLSLVVPRSSVNKPVDEGCAYLYGGSWGFTWKQIWSEFMTQVATNTNTDWMTLKETPVYFKTGNYKNAVDYIVNALLVQKIEKEKGFAGVWEFLNCGKFEKGNAKYYQTLEKLTGINQKNYNQTVWELVKAQNSN